MSKQKKNKSTSSYLIKAVLMLLVTLLVVYATSYFRQVRTPEKEPPVSAKEHSPNSSDDNAIAPTPAQSAESIAGNLSEMAGTVGQMTPDGNVIYSINESMPDLSSMIDFFAFKYNCASASVVVYDAELREFYTYTYGYGDIHANRPVDTSTKFCVASLSKLVTVICAMTLVDDGKLDLDKDISEYLGYDVRNPKFPDKEITARMIIQHTSSLYDSDSFHYTENKYLPETTEQLLDSGNCYLGWEPGTGYSYSPYFAYSVLGLVCENLTGKRFDTFARDVLFDPLGIDAAFLPGNLQDKTNVAVIYERNHESFASVEEQLSVGMSEIRISDHDLVSANLTISPVDYAKILIMLGNGGAFGEVEVLSESSIQEIHKANVLTGGYRQALSTRFQNDDSIPFVSSYWHPGGGRGIQSQYIRYISGDKNRGVVVATTGAVVGVLGNGMSSICTDMSFLALQALDRSTGTAP